MTQVRVLKADGAQPGPGGGCRDRFMLDGSDTAERFAMVQHLFAPRALAAPMHRHTREDEFSVVTDGSVGFVLGDDTVTAGPGDLVRKPREQWHTFFNAGDTEARLLEIISPAGFERYFADLVPLFPPDAPPDLDAMAEVTARYGLDMDFESLPELVARFDLAAPPELDDGA